MLPKPELKSKIKHILSYGENWGFVHVRSEIQWREQSIRETERELEDTKAELIAFKQLMSKMEVKRQLKKLVVIRGN